MTSPTSHPAATANLKHHGPPLWLLAILYTVLFNAGLFPVTMYGGMPYWPGPWETPAVIAAFFQTQTTRVLACIFLQTGATICSAFLRRSLSAACSSWAYARQA